MPHIRRWRTEPSPDWTTQAQSVLIRSEITEEPKDIEEGYSWALMDARKVKELADGYITVPAVITTVAELETATKRLMEELTSIADEAVPKRK